METQVAPLAQLSSALSSGQSDTASEPSFIASVSRLGLATDPESRWSRPITTGGQPLELDFLLRHIQPAVQVRIVGDKFFYFGIGFVNILRIARERHPAER